MPAGRQAHLRPGSVHKAEHLATRCLLQEVPMAHAMQAVTLMGSRAEHDLRHNQLGGLPHLPPDMAVSNSHSILSDPAGMGSG